MYGTLRLRNWHPGWSGVPHQADFLRGEAVGRVDQVVELVFQLQRLARQKAGRLDRAGIFVPETSEPGRGQGVLASSGFLDLNNECVGLEGQGVFDPVDRVGDSVLDSEPI